MKKYFLCFTCILCSAFAFGQQKKTAPKPIPVKANPVPPPPEVRPGVYEPPTGNYELPPIVMPASDMIQISATQKNGAPVDINNMEELAKMDFSQLKTLSLSTRLSDKILDQTVLQRIIEEAVELEILSIDHFIIAGFPDIKTPNTHLKKLVLDRNQLNALPASIGNLQALETLSCSNPLKGLPPSFATLKNMKELGLYDIEFTKFPDELFTLNKLSILYISGSYKGNTKIKELPDLFGQLPGLKELGISYAGLSTLPASIGQLKYLNKVDFSHNLFSAFPAALANSMHLEYVPFSSNPLKWNDFLASVKQIKWQGLFFLHETGLSKQQYETVQQILSKTDVYYDGMND